MDVTLRVRLERAVDKVVWWADSPELAGFSAAADSMGQLRDRARAAIVDILIERNEELGVVREELVPTVIPRGVGATSAPEMDSLQKLPLVSRRGIEPVLAFA